MDADRRDSFASLQDLLKKKPRSAPGERCDYCSVPLDSEHSHLIDLKSRRILCSCRPCYIVFQPQGAAQGRYKPVPSRYAEVEGFSVGDGEWDSLQIPIRPSLVASSCSMRSDSELSRALLPTPPARIVDQSPLIVPIDAAYELVGLMRTSWRGFDGGEEAWKRIDAFFSKISERAQGRVTARLS